MLLSGRIQVIMAFLIDLQDHFHTTDLQQQATKESQRAAFRRRTRDFYTSLRGRDARSTIDLRGQHSDKALAAITLDLFQGYEAVILFEAQLCSQEMRLTATVAHQGSACHIGSSEIRRNIGRIVKLLNSVARPGDSALVIAPQTGCISARPPKQLVTEAFAAGQLIALAQQAVDCLKELAPALLLFSNLPAKLPEGLRKAGFAGGERLGEIYELLPLVNCAQEATGEFDSANLCRIIQLYNQQLARPLFKDSPLFSAPLTPTPVGTNFQREAGQLHFPIPKDAEVLPFLFSSVMVVQHDKKKDRCLFEGGKGKLIASPSKFYYAQSVNIFQGKSKGEGSSEETEDCEKSMREQSSIDKTFLVKIGKASANEAQQKRSMQAVRYEKQVLANLRTAKCSYFPRYFHSTQKNYEYKDCLLMDYLPGPTLADQLRADRLSHFSKLQILSHLTNAIRFLQRYRIAHLDLSPANIIVNRDFSVKVIDFGQAFHPATTGKYLRGQGGRLQYSPGRTFPYAPPETSIRNDNLTSQQDMYSLGMIVSKLLLDSFPFVCSEEKTKQLYQRKQYANRVFFSPQRLQDYGHTAFMSLVLWLVLKLIEPEERLRPFPLWAHLITKKLFYTIR